MSKKHNAKHDRRGISNYPQRLLDRGESSVSVRMPFIDRQGRHHGSMDAVLRRDNTKEEPSE